MFDTKRRKALGSFIGRKSPVAKTKCPTAETLTRVQEAMTQVWEDRLAANEPLDDPQELWWLNCLTYAGKVDHRGMSTSTPNSTLGVRAVVDMLPRLEEATPETKDEEANDECDLETLGEPLTPDRPGPEPSALDKCEATAKRLRKEANMIRRQVGWIEAEIRRREQGNPALTRNQKRRYKCVRALLGRKSGRATDRSLRLLSERRRGLLRVKGACLADATKRVESMRAEMSFGRYGPASLASPDRQPQNSRLMESLTFGGESGGRKGGTNQSTLH